jgi:hypothetical protein
VNERRQLSSQASVHAKNFAEKSKFLNFVESWAALKSRMQYGAVLLLSPDISSGNPRREPSASNEKSPEKERAPGKEATVHDPAVL